MPRIAGWTFGERRFQIVIVTVEKFMSGFFLCITIFYGVKTYFIALVSDKGKRKRNGEEFSFCIQRTNKMIYDYGGIYEKKGDFLKC